MIRRICGTNHRKNHQCQVRVVAFYVSSASSTATSRSQWSQQHQQHPAPSQQSCPQPAAPSTTRSTQHHPAAAPSSTQQAAPRAWDVACIARVLPHMGQSVDCSARTPHPSQQHPTAPSTQPAAPRGMGRGMHRTRPAPDGDRAWIAAHAPHTPASTQQHPAASSSIQHHPAAPSSTQQAAPRGVGRGMHRTRPAPHGTERGLQRTHPTPRQQHPAGPSTTQHPNMYLFTYIYIHNNHHIYIYIVYYIHTYIYI